MLTAIDHLIIDVPDLEAAVKSYQGLGFTVMPGGRHTGIGTYNALIAFQDTAYLELIAFYEPRPDHRWWAPLQQGGGLVDFCLQTDDLAGDAAALRRAGIDMGEPEHRDRKRPDGFEVRWTFALARGAHRGVAPFVITDRTPRDERVPRERRHPNGVTGVATVVAAVDDVARVRGWYGAVLGQPVKFVRRPIRRRGCPPRSGRTRSSSRRRPGGGPLFAWLRTRGARYAATLTTSGGPWDHWMNQHLRRGSLRA